LGALEFDLAVLGLPAFRDVEVRHDLDARDDGVAIAVGKGLIEPAASVDPEADFHVFLADIRLDVNIRRPAGVGVVDDLVDELHDDAVGLGDGLVFLFLGFVLRRIRPAQDIADAGVVPLGLKEIGDVLVDVLGQGDVVDQLLGLHQAFDRIPLEDVVGIVDDDADGVSLALQGHPELPLEVFLLEVFQQVAGDGELVVVGDELAAVELFEGFPEVILGNPVFRHDVALDRLLLLAGLLPGGVELIFLERAAGDEVVEAGLAAAGEALLVEEGDAEHLGDLFDEGNLFLVEFPRTALLVEDLDDPHEFAAVVHRGGEDLARPVAGLLVPALVERKFLVDGFQFEGVVGVGDVDNLAVVGAVAGDAFVADRHPDLFELGPGQDLGVDFVLHTIDDVNRQGVGVEELEDSVLEINEDLLDVLRGMNTVGDVLKLLAQEELFLVFVHFRVLRRRRVRRTGRGAFQRVKHTSLLHRHRKAEQQRPAPAATGMRSPDFTISFGKIGDSSHQMTAGYPQYHCQAVRLNQNEKKFNRNFIDRGNGRPAAPRGGRNSIRRSPWRAWKNRRSTGRERKWLPAGTAG